VIVRIHQACGVIMDKTYDRYLIPGNNLPHAIFGGSKPINILSKGLRVRAGVIALAEERDLEIGFCYRVLSLDYNVLCGHRMLVIDVGETTR
jgi:hypothetical protein